jgi:protein TonB
MKNSIMKYFFAVLLNLFIGLSCMAQATEPEAVSSQALEVKPAYPDGMGAFYQYIGNNFRTPDVDKDLVLKIVVTFVVEKDGSLSGIKVIKDPGYGTGEEAVRVLKACPKKWTPGVQNGKPVRAQFNLPITINVTGSGTTEETEKQ